MVPLVTTVLVADFASVKFAAAATVVDAELQLASVAAHELSATAGLDPPVGSTVA